MPRDVCCAAAQRSPRRAEACKRLFLELFTSLSGLHSQKRSQSLRWREKLPVGQPRLALRKRILKPDTATNAVLRALSRFTESCSCVSVAVFLLPDTDKFVSVFHVTTSPRHHVCVAPRHVVNTSTFTQRETEEKARSRRQNWAQPQTHYTKRGHATQSEAKKKAPNPHTGRKARHNHRRRPRDSTDIGTKGRAEDICR
jgi:hypothetical protein